MIQTVINTSSGNPSLEIWKHLRLFLNLSRTTKAIRSIHGIEAGSQEQNIKKQAAQIAYSIRQAEQYFVAAESVGLATKPLLLYYGCVSLSQALVLMRRDGTHSLDALRKIEKHRHHGLVLDHGKAEQSKSAVHVEEFFNLLECSFFKKPDGTLWGHFPVFYSALQPSAFIMPYTWSDFGAPSSLSQELPVSSADILPLDQLSGRPLNALELLKTLPDLYGDLRQLGIRADLAPGSAKRTTVFYYKPVPINQISNATLQPGSPTGHKELQKLADTFEFFVNRLAPDQKATFVSLLIGKNPQISVAAEHPNNVYLRLHFESPDSNFKVGYCPDIVDAIVGELFYILKPTTYIHEAAALLAIMYCLGMLARYYPDVWMSTIDKNVDVVEITNDLLTVIARKFPNLILDQMTEAKHYVHL